MNSTFSNYQIAAFLHCATLISNLRTKFIEHIFRMTDDSADGNWLEDLCNMLHKSTRLEVRLTASSNVMALTGSDEGRMFIRQNKPLVSKQLLRLAIKIIKDGSFVCDAK